ncbi:MAG: DUF1501 domain-containing protein, partial [Saprospiraceae bacterium]|nr:DUF1501 domain-containing protein [Saprospiraceae bacterium]
MNNKRLSLAEEAHLLDAQLATRRLFLKQCSMGLGALAFSPLINACTSESTGSSNTLFDPTKPLLPKTPHLPGKAKSVIYLHMAGAPSQLELFDYKPELKKLDGQLCPESLLKGKKFAFIRGVPKMLGTIGEFKQRGQSGAWVSHYLPHLAGVADELSFLKAVHTDQFNHAPAQLLMQTGSARLGRPSLGSWVTYGLGSENANLPGFVVLTSGGQNPDAGKSVWGSGFLPSVYQGVHCRSHGEPVLYLDNPANVDGNM